MKSMSRKAKMVVVDAQREAMAVAYMAFPLPGGGQEETIELLDWKAIS
jgi:hypothetical protein